MPDKGLCTSQSRYELGSRSVSKSLRRVIRKSKILLIDEKGQSLVEFALVTLFIILPVVFGIIDGSILFYKWVVVTNAAREGARAGAIYHYTGSAPAVGPKGEVDMVDAARRDAIMGAVDATIGPLVSIQWSQADDWEILYDPDYECVLTKPAPCGGYDVYRNGTLVTVEITHTHSPYVGLVIGVDRIDLTASATMRIEPGLPLGSLP